MDEWLHHDLMTQLGAGGMLRVCRYCVAVKISNFSQVRIAVDHDFFFFFLCGVSSEAPLCAVKLAQQMTSPDEFDKPLYDS